MCRVVAYAGRPLSIDALLYEPSGALVRQTVDPQRLQMLNLGGFGMLAWDPQSPRPELPFRYQSTQLPIYDANLRSLARKVRSTALLAHVRGIAYHSDAGFGPHNLHPFLYSGARWAMAHNGDLVGHAETKFDLLKHARPEFARQIRGTTDSETIYALVLSQLDEPDTGDDPLELCAAVEKTIRIIRRVRAQHGIDEGSSLNLFFSDGVSTVALRYGFDFGCYATDRFEELRDANLDYLSLWYTAGEAFEGEGATWRMAGRPDRTESVIIASEPLTHDITGWVEIPEYSALVVDRRGGVCRLASYEVSE